MYNGNACYEANNYTDILYFLSNSNLNPHIDRMYFSGNSEIVNPVEKLVYILEKIIMNVTLISLQKVKFINV
jgi:hypothetical protein